MRDWKRVLCTSRVLTLVLQLDEGEGTNILLPVAGFYRAATLHPDDAAARLRKERCEQ